MKTKIKLTAHKNGISGLIEPLCMVEIQLNTLIALGMATMNVNTEKVYCAVPLIPEVNMWCPQTKYRTKAMARVEATMALYPKICFCEKVGIISEMAPMAGRIIT